MKNFELPTRQSPWAIFFMIINFLKPLTSQLIIIFLALLIGRKNAFEWNNLWFYLLLLSISLIFLGIVNYFRFVYYLENKEFITKSGIISRSKKSVPFSNVQSIKIEKNLFHKLFGVVQLRIETAGTSKTEVVLNSLQESTALSLQDIITQNQRYIENKPHKKEVITHKVSTKNLCVIGLLQNHFISVNICIAITLIIPKYAIEIGYTEKEIKSFLIEILYFFGQYHKVHLILSLISMIVILSVSISILRVLIVYYNQQIQLTNDKICVSKGLFKNMSIKSEFKNIQHIKIEQTFLEKLFKYHKITIYLTSSISGGKSNKISGIGITDNFFKSILSHWDVNDSTKEIWCSISKHYLYRITIYLAISFVTFVFICILIFPLFVSFGLILLYLGLFLLFLLKFKKKKFRYSQNSLNIKGGVLGNSLSILPIHKIQSIKMVSNIYQRKRNLTSLKLYMTNGVRIIPYISISKAKALTEYILYTLENRYQTTVK